MPNFNPHNFETVRFVFQNLFLEMKYRVQLKIFFPQHSVPTNFIRKKYEWLPEITVYWYKNEI